MSEPLGRETKDGYETADLGLEAVAELPADAPHLDGLDATVVGVAREAGAPIVAGESDFTHDAVRDRLNAERDGTPSENVGERR